MENSLNDLNYIEDNLKKVFSDIKEAENACGRKEGSVKLVAVSKFHPAECVIRAVEAGQFLFGENRVQEALSKFTQIKESLSNEKVTEGKNISLQIIGKLQSNKVKKACLIADTISSVDSIDLIKDINRHCETLNKKMEILLELHTGEDTKSGFAEEKELFKALEYLAGGNAPYVSPSGFMTMAPFTDDEKIIRSSFITLRESLEKANAEFPELKLSELSMGMSSDYKIAIQEGSTQVRIGTAIFGQRLYT
ncbi:MAG: YggS family pyridoxal phosphate-dependent enzyme [Treponema sp.]|nr:YggS family pyridoxal phosphate-dependent enzyme [Treponema sp.]